MDLEASTIATLVEFSELEAGLFLALTSRWSESFAKTVFETVNVTGWEVLFGTSSNHSDLMDALIKHKGLEATEILVADLLSRGEPQNLTAILVDVAGWEVLFKASSNHSLLMESLIKNQGMEATRSLVKSLLSRASTSKNAKMIPVLSKLLKSTIPSLHTLPVNKFVPLPTPSHLSNGHFNPPTPPNHSSLPVLKSTGPKSSDTQRPSPPHLNSTSEHRQPTIQSLGEGTSESNLHVEPEGPSQQVEPLSPPRPTPRPSQPVRPQPFPMEDLNIAGSKSDDHPIRLASKSQPTVQTDQLVSTTVLGEPRSDKTHPASETQLTVFGEGKQLRNPLPPSASPPKPLAAVGPQPRAGNTAREGDVEPVPHSPRTVSPSQDAHAETVPPAYQLLETEERGSDEADLGEPEPDEMEDSGDQFSSSVNPWDAATNAQMVEGWGIEGRIHDQPMHTAPARTTWMYEDRKKALGMTDEEYKALTDREYADFTKIPVAARGHAGLVFHKKSKFDWEVRVRLGKIAYDYHQLDEPEDREYLRAALVEIEKRFPDLSPSHIFRRIDEQGHKAVEKWWMDIAKWVQTAAGKMRVTLEELEGHVEILVGKKKNVKYDPTRLLGLKRAEVNYVLWGRTPSGEDKCHDLIEKEVDIWKKKNTAAIAKDGRVVGQYRLGVEGRIRREQFGRLPASVRQHYTTLAKGGVVLTPEQQKAAAEALIPNLVNTCSRSSAVANMHILLFASTVTTGDRIPVVMKEFGADPVNGPFLDGQDLGTRVKADYTSYAGRLWKGDPSQIDLLDKSVEEDPPSADQGQTNKGKATGASAKSTKSNKSTQQNDSTKSKGKRNAAPAVPENPQRPTKPSYTEWKPLAAVRTEKQRIDYMGSFFGSTYRNNFSGQMKWNPISANNDLYIDPVRRPEDQHGEPLPLSNPQAMPGPLLQSWWNFLQDCANGEIPEDRRFMWKSEETRLNLPDIAAPEDPGIHAAGELAKSTVSRKRARGEPNRPRKSQKQKSQVKPTSAVDDEEDEMLEDLEDLWQDAEKWGADPNDEPEPSRALRRRPSQPEATNLASNKSTGHESGDSSGSEGSEFQPDKTSGPSQSRRSKAGIEPDVSIVQGQTKNSATSARVKGLRILSEEPTDLTLPSKSGAPGLSLEQQTRQLEPTTSDLQTRQSKPTTVPPATPSKSLSPAKRPPPPLHVPIEEQPYSEVRLGHPLFLSVEAQGSGSPAWLQLRAALKLWGSRLSSLSVTESQILLSPSARKPDVAPPSVLVSSISIAQTFLSLQKPNPHLPQCPIIKLSPTCGLDNVAPLHHVRFVIESILNVEAPLPTAKSIESNLPLEPDAIKAFFRVLEKSLENFIDSLTKDEDAVRYAEVEYLTMIRLALFVRSTAFMVDDGLQDDTSRRVTSAMDRLVTVLGAVSIVRYIEAYMGGAAERWYVEEGLKRTPASQIWFYVWRLFKTAAPSLACALVQGRSDIFNYRGLESIIPSSLKDVFDQILTQPVWWSAPGNGVPEAFVIGMKQFIPSTTTFNRLQAVEWWRLSFIDRVVVLMTIFGAAVQLSAEPMDSPRLKVPEQKPSKSLFERLEVCCSSMMRMIGEEAGPEDGPKFTKDISEREEQKERQMRGWILVWEAERGPSFPFVPTVPDPSSHLTASASPAEVKSAQSTDAPKPPEGLLSQGSSIVPATPSAHYDEEDDGPEGAQLPKLPTISEDAEMADVDAVLSGGLSDGDSDGVENEKGDLDENVLQEKPAPRKRKVGGDSLQIEENPAAADGRHERPRRRAHLQNPYFSSTPAVRRREEQELTNRAGPSSSKKPQGIKGKVDAAAKADKPSASPRKLTTKQKRAEAARKAAATKAANKAKKGMKQGGKS